LVAEAARLLQVAEGTVRRWADTGRIGVRRTGGGLRIFERSEVERLAAERVARAKDDGASR